MNSGDATSAVLPAGSGIGGFIDEDVELQFGAVRRAPLTVPVAAVELLRVSELGLLGRRVGLAPRCNKSTLQRTRAVGLSPSQLVWPNSQR